MALSTTIIRFSPTPPVDPDAQPNLSVLGLDKNLDQVQPLHSKSLDPLPAQQSKSLEPLCSASTRSCSRSQSECNYPCPRGKTGDFSAGCRSHEPLSESNVRKFSKVDSGYCSNPNIQQIISAAAPQNPQQWGTTSSMPLSVYAGGIPPSYSSEGLHYLPVPSFKPQCAGLIDLPRQEDVLSRHPLFSSQLAQPYLASEAPLHPSAYHAGNGPYTVSSTGMFLFNK